jgi:hypothetical protein
VGSGTRPDLGNHVAAQPFNWRTEHADQGKVSPMSRARRRTHSSTPEIQPEGEAHMPDIDRAIREGLDGWDRDDLDRLASLLAAEAELVWYEPGAWDCHGNPTIQLLIRRCLTEGTGGPYRVHTRRINKTALVTSPTHRDSHTLRRQKSPLVSM